MDERSCIELAAALGVTSHGGWRDLVDRVKAIASVPGGPGRAYDDVRHAIGARGGGGGGIPWHELVAEVKDARERSDSVKHVTGELAEAMGMTDMGRWSDLLDTVRRWRADREPSPAQPAGRASALRRIDFGDIAKALDHGYDTNVATILDSITRLKETNLRLENERGTALSEERAEHERTRSERDALRQAFDGFRLLIRRSIEPAVPPAGADAEALHLAVHAAATEILQLRERVAGSTEDESDAPDDVCDDCGEAICECCNTCHDCTGECDAGSGAEEPTEEPTAVSRAVDAMITAMLTSGRDWRVNAVDAWLYGIVIGWDLDEMTDVAERHRWPNGARMRLIELHDAMQEALASVLR